MTEHVDRKKQDDLEQMTRDFEKEYKEDPEKVEKLADGIYSKFQKFLSINEPDVVIKTDVVTNKEGLAEVVLRVDKWKSYFAVFHGDKYISEFKEIALYAFCIMKLKPFRMVDNTHKLVDSVNEYFAIHLILSTIKGCCLYKKKQYMHPCNDFIDEVVYSFRFHDLNKEALMLFVDTLALGYGIYHLDVRN